MPAPSSGSWRGSASAGSPRPPTLALAAATHAAARRSRRPRRALGVRGRGARPRRPTRRRRCSAAWPRSRAALGHDGLPRVVEDAAPRPGAAARATTSPRRCASFVAGAAHHLLGDRDAATAALDGRRPARGGRGAGAPRALPRAARRPRRRARGLGRGEPSWSRVRARRSTATASRTRPRPRSCSPPRRSCAPTPGAATRRAPTSPPPRGCRRGWSTSRPGTTPSCASSAAGRRGACATCPTRSRACCDAERFARRVAGRDRAGGVAGAGARPARHRDGGRPRRRPPR